MSDFYCPTCKQFRFGRSHRCPPVWLVRPEWYEEEDAARIYAESARAAAEEWSAHNHSRYDYFIALELLIKPEADDEAPWVAFDIEVEAVPHFTVRERAAVRS